MAEAEPETPVAATADAPSRWTPMNIVITVLMGLVAVIVIDLIMGSRGIFGFFQLVIFLIVMAIFAVLSIGFRYENGDRLTTLAAFVLIGLLGLLLAVAIFGGHHGSSKVVFRDKSVTNCYTVTVHTPDLTTDAPSKGPCSQLTR